MKDPAVVLHIDSCIGAAAIDHELRRGISASINISFREIYCCDVCELECSALYWLSSGVRSKNPFFGPRILRVYWEDFSFYGSG